MPEVASPRLLALLGLLAAVGAFAAALISQHVFGLQPCALCIWQRYPYGPGIAAAALAVALGDGSGFRLAAAAAALSFLAGAGLAAFHGGVELRWWEGLPSCGGAPPEGLTGPQLMEWLATPRPRCDERTPFFIGLTMANWNMLICLGLSGLFGAAALRDARATQGARRSAPA